MTASRRPTKVRLDITTPTARLPRELPLDVLRGVGPALTRRLADRGLVTVEDLLFLLPLEVQDHRELRPLTALTPGERATSRGLVVRARRHRGRRRQRLEVGLAAEPGGPPLLWCVWFRAHRGMMEAVQRGRWLVVTGTVRTYQDVLQMAHPDLWIEGAEEDRARPSIRARYPEIPGVAPRRIERLCQQACERFAGDVDDAVPPAVADALHLPSQAEALRALHLIGEAPDAASLAAHQRGEHPAFRRLVFDELFSLQLAAARHRLDLDRRPAHPCPLSPAARRRLVEVLPFSLTAAQQRVMAEILADLALPRPMHRLLQGDVGSGKTAVAFAAALAVMACGLQAAVMAPTELLARQHFFTMEPWCIALGHRATLLTAATPAATRRAILADSDGGGLLVGTHALLSPRLDLPRLGLAVVDEQHRFGVMQRVRLRQGESAGTVPLPHLLVMTATPIPRTLALSLHGDLDLSVVDELPPGRRPVETRLFLEGEREEALELLEAQLARGRRTFLVCPLVERSSRLPLRDVETTATHLARRFPGQRVGLVHGRLPLAERDRMMEAFRRGALDLLVATTVIEVGIDVPDAEVMVVEHADRFGLAQLHQLRGRVGRRAGGEPALCLLLAEVPPASPAGERLAALVRSEDGFEIAEADLLLRGPGELCGTRQSGRPRLRFADLRRHLPLLAEAQRRARTLLTIDPELRAPGNETARRVMLQRWEHLAPIGAEAG